MNNAQTEARAIARFEITYDPDIGMIHRPHDHGYYVRYEDHATALAAKDAELAELKLKLAVRDRERDYLKRRWDRAEAQLAKLNKALEPFAKAADRAHETAEDRRLLDLFTVGARLTIGDLRAAGFRILGPDEVDTVTVEKAAVASDMWDTAAAGMISKAIRAMQGGKP